MKAPMPGPVILMGMHRSGTTVLVRSLTRLGLFTGYRKQQNDEAVLFRRYNDHLFALAGARWDQPEPARIWEAEAGPGVTLAQRLREALSSYQTFSFLGPIRYLRHRGLEGFPEPWGWKDPRNTFLLDLWLRVFPGARVIHVTRHGVDVAASLRTRHQDRFRLYEGTSARGLAALRSSPNPAASLRCQTLQGGFTLWQEYMAQGRAVLSRIPSPERTLEVRFEDLALEPEETLAGVAAFAGLESRGQAIREVARGISAERANAWSTVPELQSFAAQVQDGLEAAGYPV